MKTILDKIRKTLGSYSRESLSDAAKAQKSLDHAGLPSVDAGLDATIEAAVLWLCQAQDSSASADGGVARGYNLNRGWQSSYPETTGYIIPTVLDCANATKDDSLRERARRMLQWLVQIQLPSGAFQGGKIDSKPVVPVVFNTGQILMGLSAGESEFGTYRQALLSAADWLVQVQDTDGCWRKHSTPFALAGEKTYETHTAWGLLEAARLVPDRGYGDAALANVRWALTRQRSNGWMDNCCLSDFSQPLTHTLGYALRGIWEAYRYSRNPEFLGAARRLADGLKGALRDDGFLPGCLMSNWSPAADWACLTGTVQTAYCWLALFQETGEPSYREAGFLANRYVRRTVQLDGPEECRGAVKGSFPINGDYCQYEYPNWATKFLIDALLLEREVRRGAARLPRA